MLDYYWIPVLVIAALAVTIMALVVIVVSVMWIWENRPFRYIKLSEDAVDFIDDLQRDMYKNDFYEDDFNER
ncbi:hypothetical protein [uncultured Mediterranean phage uvMED]|nr:hypothetical protein [uncultured Mediterranean phage uvMED]|tara:strand:+ start:306 stop:521 length:216 start_codon:yes stop_codon:yes gene_type:complete